MRSKILYLKYGAPVAKACKTSHLGCNRVEQSCEVVLQLLVLQLQ